MSSAVQQTRPVIHSATQPQHAMAVMRALAPSIDALATTFLEGANSRETVSVNRQLMDLQSQLAQAARQLKAAVPVDVLEKGDLHQDFMQNSNRPQGSWIVGTLNLLSSLEVKIRDQMYANPFNNPELRDEVFTTDNMSDTSLPRVLRAFTKSYFHTNLYLGVPADRAQIGVTVDFTQPGLRRFLANSTNIA